MKSLKTAFVRPQRLLAMLALAASAAVHAAETPALKGQIERGRYLVNVAGCNTCHTPGFLTTGNKTPDRLLLTGSDQGWRGSWGTTYAANLRLYFDNITEDQWLQVAREVDRRPTMPYFALNAMSKSDLRAIYRYMRHLGPAGSPEPKAVSPGGEAPPAYVQFGL